MSEPSAASTLDPGYAERLLALGNVWWKRVLDVQRPYRWHLRALRPGFVLDVGCGIGRNLKHLRGRGVGVDHNPTAVEHCRASGLTAMTPEEFQQSQYVGTARFDSLLVSHVLEHMDFDSAADLLRSYLRHIKPGGRVILIVPQEAGQRSDPTHVQFINLATLHRLARSVGLQPEKAYSFPFPRPAGHFFIHNESIVVARYGDAG